MQSYLGAQAILVRLGYSPRQYRRFAALMDKYQWPCYPKRIGIRTFWYSSESMITAWELAKAKTAYERLHSERLAGVDRRFKARQRLRKSGSHNSTQSHPPQPVGIYRDPDA